MSVQTTSLQSWTNHNSYNQFPSVEYARNSITVERQIEIGRVLANLVPELIGRFGTTLTHGHHGLKQNESIVGYFHNGSLLSKPKERTDATCPTTWAGISGELLATEGIDNASPEVVQLAKVVEKCASRILQHLPRESDKKFSILSIAIDPRRLCNTDYTYFVETNDKDMSILTPQQKKEPQVSEEKIIPTYKSIDSAEASENPSTTWCSSDCLTSGGNHYYSHMKES